MKPQKLAIQGGRRSVIGMFPTPWTRIAKAITLTVDLSKALPRIVRGRTTSGDGSGIVKKFETAFKNLTGSEYALAMNSGTATLHSAYFAVGVGPGDEVIVPAYTWHASATPVLQCGATPVFCDVDPRTLTADPDDIERKITDRTKAICVVHVWGNPAEMDRISDIAKRRNIAIIEDCSHAHGAIYNGKAVGTWGEVGCFSLNGKKAVDAGEGGVAVTDDPALFDRMLILGHFGRIKKGQAADTFDFGDMSLGLKYRPHQCAMHLAYGSLKRLPKLNDGCARSWKILCDELRDVRGIRPPETLPGAIRGGYQEFVLVYEAAQDGGPTREQFVKAVRREGVPMIADRYAQVNYTYGMLHRAPLFTAAVHREVFGAGRYDPTRADGQSTEPAPLPVCERLTNQLVSMPRMDTASARYVRSCARAIKKVLAVLHVPATSTTTDHSEPPSAPQDPVPSKAYA